MEQECTVNVRHGCAHFVTFSEPRGSTGNHCLRVVSSTDRAFLSIRSRGQSRQKCSGCSSSCGLEMMLAFVIRSPSTHFTISPFSVHSLFLVIIETIIIIAIDDDNNNGKSDGQASPWSSWTRRRTLLCCAGTGPPIKCINPQFSRSLTPLCVGVPGQIIITEFIPRIGGERIWERSTKYNYWDFNMKSNALPIFTIPRGLINYELALFNLIVDPPTHLIKQWACL